MFRKTTAAIIAAAVVMVISAASAWAASSGSVSLSIDSTSYVGTYVYDCSIPAAGGRLGVCTSGTLSVWDGNNAHLNMNTEGYGWTQIARVTTSSSTGSNSASVNMGVWDPAATSVSHMQLQLCHERPILWDNCTGGTYDKY